MHSEFLRVILLNIDLHIETLYQESGKQDREAINGEETSPKKKIKYRVFNVQTYRMGVLDIRMTKA